MAAAEEVTSRCFAPVDGEPDERRESAGVALSQTTPARDNSRRTLLDGKMVDGVEGIMRVCPELCSPLCLVCINVFFSISSSFLACYPPPPHTHSFSSSSTSLCLSVLCGVSTVVITLLTDAGLQAMQHLSTSLSLRSHCQTYTFALKHLPRYHGARSQSLIFGKKKQRHARTGTWHVSSFSHD